MELFSVDPKMFEEEVLKYDLRIRDVVRAFPPNQTYRIKGVDKRNPLSCGIIAGYGLTEPAVIGAPPIPVVRMVFLVKPLRDAFGFSLTQMIDNIPVGTLQETSDTPEAWFERTYKYRHPLTWLDMCKLGAKQMVMEQEGAVRRLKVADAEEVAAREGKPS